MGLKQWERAYRKAAKADRSALFRQHLSMLELPDQPELLLEGTLNVVRACVAYSSLDNQSYEDFLAMQTYDPADSSQGVYSYTFNLCENAFARVMVREKVQSGLDLADILNHPWDDYRVCGYRCFWVSRIDGRKLSLREIARITKDVTNDLRFDYSEEELSIDFDDQSLAGVLRVDVQEPWNPEEDE